ncbi:MAG: hypothetical protein EAZ51_04105 [Sphingobacteriales bacterium]|nr:MAG: hypothetical protein EAZ64_08130 [Sphingobacteriales bacterium]TAF81460.1 MAG: hypothetical protein EAZ51_04105 [Sphingobacteriales bacterium]
MKILSPKYITFFMIVLLVSPLIGMLLFNEQLNATFLARAIFTASLSTLVYFMLNKKLEKK